MNTKDVLKSGMMANGEVFAITSGEFRMQKLSADSWDLCEVSKLFIADLTVGLL